MPEITVDVTVANRFISSLSKSLQALCHGCMDFDNGIEIVGYINVNIDSGSKVDYVLNEKVLKSTTNSMTFVSNSFLAKKDQPKQTRDGSCSPVAEIQLPAYNPASHYRSSYQGSGGQYPRSNLPYSSHSHVLRGSQKRSYPGGERDWRSTPRKHSRGGRQYPFSHDQSYPASRPYASYPASSMQTSENDPSLTSTSTDSSDPQLSVNIKQEKLESDDQSASDPAQQNESGEGGDSSTTQAVNIKTDPDAPPPPAADQGGGGIDNGDSADVKNSFLDQPEGSDQASSFQQVSNSEGNESEIPSFDTPFPVTSGSEVQNPAESGSNVASGNMNYEENNVASGSGMGGDYEDQDYSHSSYADPEASGDGSQLDIIEIEDEDEDVQAIFGGSSMYLPAETERSLFAGPGAERSNDSGHLGDVNHRLNSRDTVSRCAQGKQLCTTCRIVLGSPLEFNDHMFEVHGCKYKYFCKNCGKGYVTASGLYRHNQVNKGTRFPCPVCGVSFTQRNTVKIHMTTAHPFFR